MIYFSISIITLILLLSCSPSTQYLLSNIVSKDSLPHSNSVLAYDHNTREENDYQDERREDVFNSTFDLKQPSSFASVNGTSSFEPPSFLPPDQGARPSNESKHESDPTESGYLVTTPASNPGTVSKDAFLDTRVWKQIQVH